jgi:FAD-dependent oxidoreductase domain-containing protein 1
MNHGAQKQPLYADVVIVGGAVIGSAAAYFLSAETAFGGSIVVVEQDLSYAKCATMLSAASIRQQFSTPENIRISQFGVEFMKNLPQRLSVDDYMPDIGFQERGYLFLATDRGKGELALNHRVQRSNGANVQLLTIDDLSRLFPWLNTRDLSAGSLGLSGEGWFDASSLLQSFKRKAIANGVKYRQAVAIAVERSGRMVRNVLLSDGATLNCGVLINAAGTGARALAHLAGIELPVESRKRCVFYFHSPLSISDSPLVIDPTGAYFRPEGNGYISGVAPSADSDPECYDFDVQYELFDDVLWPVLAARVPGFESLRLMRAWAGHYDMNLFDHNVILGAHPEIDNLLFANGFSGHGVQQAPAIGRALSELVTFNGFRTLDLSALGWRRLISKQALVETTVV